MDEFGSELKPLLIRLHTFASSVHHKHFEGTTGNILSRSSARSTVMLVRTLANSMCPGSDIRSTLLKKAIQESLLQAVDVKINISKGQFEKRLHDYLMENGSKGLIQLFLTSYVNAVTWFTLSSALGSSLSPEKNRQLVREIDSAASLRVQAITARWRRWPRMDVRDAEVVSTALETYLFGEQGSILKWQEIIRSESKGFSA